MGRKKEDLETRLKKRVWINPRSQCWEWQGARNNVGYGMIRVSQKRGMATVHRTSYELYIGKIPTDMLVLHKCGTYTCCNPDHLELGNRLTLTRKLMATDNYNPFGRNDPDFYQACDVCGHITTKRVLLYYHNDKCIHKVA